MDVEAARTALSTATTGWIKASASNGGANGCFQFNFGVPGWVGLRDSKLGDASPVLVFNQTELDAMIAGARAGEFDNRIQ